MKDFEQRFISPFQLGLNWRWPNIRIESETVTDYVPVNCLDKEECRQMVDSTKKYCVVKIFYPEEYKIKFPEWHYEYCTPITQACAQILYALGLGCALGDAIMLKKVGYFTFWVEINEVVYNRLPGPIPRQLSELDVQPPNLPHLMHLMNLRK